MSLTAHTLTPDVQIRTQQQQSEAELETFHLLSSQPRAPHHAGLKPDA